MLQRFSCGRHQAEIPAVNDKAVYMSRIKQQYNLAGRMERRDNGPLYLRNLVWNQNLRDRKIQQLALVLADEDADGQPNSS